MGRWGARGSPRCPPRGRAAAPGPARRPRDRAGSGPGGPGSSDAARPQAHGPFGGDVTVGGTGHASPESPDSGEPARSLAPAPWRQGPGEEGAGAGRQAASPSAAGARECQDAGVTFGASVAPGASEEGRRGSETSVRPEAAAAPAAWDARFPSEPVSLLGALSRPQIHAKGRSADPSRALLGAGDRAAGGRGGGERWGFVSEWTKPSVTMRYWGAGGGEAARLNGGPGP